MLEYRQSRFTLSFPIEKSDDELTAVYNTLTEALVLMPKSQWMSVANKDSATDSKTIEKFLQQGILIRNGVDESVVFKEWKDRHVHDFSTIRSKVLVTRRCNNRCTYCILKPEAKDMATETAREMDNFYLEQIIRNHPLLLILLQNRSF